MPVHRAAVSSAPWSNSRRPGPRPFGRSPDVHRRIRNCCTRNADGVAFCIAGTSTRRVRWSSNSRAGTACSTYCVVALDWPWGSYRDGQALLALVLGQALHALVLGQALLALLQVI